MSRNKTNLALHCTAVMQLPQLHAFSVVAPAQLSRSSFRRGRDMVAGDGGVCDMPLYVSAARRIFCNVLIISSTPQNNELISQAVRKSGSPQIRQIRVGAAQECQCSGSEFQKQVVWGKNCVSLFLVTDAQSTESL
ncbi:hypothetical protein BaRGS_00003243 [Batillaria attramentaria]|uniref:Uncharacterized protein n=1 Tax=Batillaria attramentaria TaxID=370345 RepID=A0ABD0M282_9CAEN